MNDAQILALMMAILKTDAWSGFSDKELVIMATGMLKLAKDTVK